MSFNQKFFLLSLIATFSFSLSATWATQEEKEENVVVVIPPPNQPALNTEHDKEISGLLPAYRRAFEAYESDEKYLSLRIKIDILTLQRAVAVDDEGKAKLTREIDKYQKALDEAQKFLYFFCNSSGRRSHERRQR